MMEAEILRSLLNGTVSLSLILVGLWLIIRWILPRLLESQQKHIESLSSIRAEEHLLNERLLADARADRELFLKALQDGLAEIVRAGRLHEERAQNRHEALMEKLEERTT